jgi:hypothetical protein
MLSISTIYNMNTSDYLVGLKINDLTGLSGDPKTKMETSQQHFKTEIERSENVNAVYNREKLYAVNLTLGIGAVFFYLYKYKFSVFR